MANLSVNLELLQLAEDESLPRLLSFVAKHKERMKIVPVVSFNDFRAEQEKGPLKIVDSADEYLCGTSFTTSSPEMTSFQKHFIDALLSEKVLDDLIVQLREWT